MLVLLSTYLSAQVWFPRDRLESTGSSEALVETPPPGADRGMPEIYRPEHVIVARLDGRTALLASGSSSYLLLWHWTQEALSYVHPPLSAPPVEPIDGPAAAQGDLPSITLVLPMVMRVSEWAERWGWQSSGLPFSSLWVDRVVLQLGVEPGIYLHDIGGKQHQLSILFESERKDIASLISSVDESLFTSTRELDVMDQYVTIKQKLKVQNIPSVSPSIVQVKKPIDSTEKLRFFPDTSVVRQIEEQDARIFTDGQRLLRLTNSGMLEYRTADTPGLPPEFARALQSGQEWVESHGGWPTDLVLGGFVQEQSKAKLQFDYRAGGNFPVETAEGAVQLDLSADRVTRFRRYPDLTEIRRLSGRISLIKPEEAIRIAAQEVSLFLFETVRQVHFAYLLREGRDLERTEWVLEPSWVIKVGAAKVYVPAELGLDRRLVTIRR